MSYLIWRFYRLLYVECGLDEVITNISGEANNKMITSRQSSSRNQGQHESTRLKVVRSATNRNRHVQEFEYQPPAPNLVHVLKHGSTLGGTDQRVCAVNPPVNENSARVDSAGRIGVSDRLIAVPTMASASAEMNNALSAAGQAFHAVPPLLVELLAKSENVSEQTLGSLALSDLPNVRAAVAHNPRTPAPQLAELAHDSLAEVRCAVADNPAISQRLLSVLLDDDNVYIRIHAAATYAKMKSSSFRKAPAATENDKQIAKFFKVDLGPLTCRRGISPRSLRWLRTVL